MKSGFGEFHTSRYIPDDAILPSYYLGYPEGNNCSSLQELPRTSTEVD